MQEDWPVRGDGNWPTFETCRLGDLENFPGGWDDLAEQMIPRNLLGVSYTSLQGIVAVSVAGRNILCFGSTGYDGRIGVDLSSSEVVMIPALEWPSLEFVNSDLPSFEKCVCAVIAKFPFYDYESGDGAFAAAASSLAEALAGIDPQCFAMGGFWELFVTDVENGDYMAEEIVSGYTERYHPE